MRVRQWALVSATALMSLIECTHLHAAMLSICRSDGQTGSARLAKVDLEVGSVFSDIGPSDPDLQTGQNFLPVKIMTDNPAVVRVPSECVQVAAHVIYNPRHLPVGPAQKRMYRYFSETKPDVHLNAIPLDRMD